MQYMLIQNIIGLVIACVFLVRSAKYAVQYADVIARQYRLSEFVVSFVIVGFVTTFPELFVFLLSALNNAPELGLGTVLGNNIADLTLVLGLIVLLGGTIHTKTKSTQYDFMFILITVLPVLLALDGVISRIDGAILIAAGVYYIRRVVRASNALHKVISRSNKRKLWSSIGIFVFSLVVVIAASKFVVVFAENIAVELALPYLTIGLVVVALGATLPELSFGIRAALNDRKNLALGDVLGGVIFDATTTIGIVTLFVPIIVSQAQIALVGAFLLIAVTAALIMLKTDRKITRAEGAVLVGVYVLFVLVQFITAHARGG